MWSQHGETAWHFKVPAITSQTCVERPRVEGTPRLWAPRGISNVVTMCCWPHSYSLKSRGPWILLASSAWLQFLILVVHTAGIKREFFEDLTSCPLVQSWCLLPPSTDLTLASHGCMGYFIPLYFHLFFLSGLQLGNYSFKTQTHWFLNYVTSSNRFLLCFCRVLLFPDWVIHVFFFPVLDLLFRR